VPFEKAEIEV